MDSTPEQRVDGPAAPEASWKPATRACYMGRLWRGDLKSRVLNLTYSFETRTGVLYLPAYACTSMSGCIALFERIDPHVQRIQTMSGDQRDTAYARIDGIWRAWQSEGEAR